MSHTPKIVNCHLCTHLSHNRISDKFRPFHPCQTLLVVRHKFLTNSAEKKSWFLKGPFTKFVHWYYIHISTGKSYPKFGVTDSRSCIRSLNVYELLLLSWMAEKFLQTFEVEKSHFLPLFCHITISIISRVLSIAEGLKFHRNITIAKGNKIYFDKFVVR